MMGYGMMGGFSIIFMIIYLSIIGYFFYLLTSMNTSLKRIADRVDNYPVVINRKKDEPDMP